MSEDKDRFGDKLRQKEKADEDRYFAEQDRAKLEKLRQPAAQTGLCPRCGIPLAKAVEHQIQVERCTQCGGLWLDKGDLRAICDREEGWAQHWLRTLLLPEETS